MSHDIVRSRAGLAVPDLAKPHWAHIFGEHAPKPAQPNYCYVAYDDHESVAVLRCFARTLTTRGASFQALAIGGVYTHDAYRRRGFATALLYHALSENSGNKIAILHAPSPSLYLSVGFRLINENTSLYAHCSHNGIRLVPSTDWSTTPGYRF